MTFWVTGGADIQPSQGQEVRGRLNLGLLGKDHRDTLEDPLRAGCGVHMRKRKEGEKEEGCKPVERKRERLGALKR